MTTRYAPYSSGELVERLEHGVVRSALHRISDYAISMISLMEEWNSHLSAPRLYERPAKSLPSALIPGRTSANSSHADLEIVAGYFGEFEYGATPPFDEVDEMVHATASLISELDNFHHTFQLDEATRYFGDFVELITYSGKSEMSRETYRSALKKAVDGFCNSCEENAHQLATFLDELEEEIRKNPPKEDFLHDEKEEDPADVHSLEEIISKNLDLLACLIADKMERRHKSGYARAVALVRKVNKEMFHTRSVPKAVRYVRCGDVSPDDPLYEEIITVRCIINSIAHRKKSGAPDLIIAKTEDACWRSITKMAQPGYKRNR